MGWGSKLKEARKVLALLASDAEPPVSLLDSRGRRKPRPNKVVDLFWRNVDKRESDGCWRWRGGTNQEGYGRLFINRKSGRIRVSASILSWILHNGPITEARCVVQVCGNRRCMNPAHLKLSAASRREGLFNGRSKLSHVKVAKIQSSISEGATERALGRLYRVAPSTVHRAASGQTWTLRKLEGPP